MKKIQHAMMSPAQSAISKQTALKINRFVFPANMIESRKFFN